MTDVRYWIWLQCVVGIGEKTFDILSTYGDPKTVYETDVLWLKKSGLFKKHQLERKSAVPLDIADEAIRICKKMGWSIITPDSEFYPAPLKEISDFPLVLYVWGDKTALINKLHIGVIGTRKPSVYGRDVAFTMTKELCASGAVIVSGGAHGIDSVAHTTAMEAGGKTLLIMGCGFGYPYLMENEEMRLKITKNGALVTEFPPYTPPTQVSFIQRNRITAGICRGVLVIEAGRKSGTLSTARRSFSYNRDVFVVTGDANGTSFLGAHELVRYGAKVIFSAQDIISLYGYEIKNKDSFYFGSFGKGVFEGIDEFPDGRKEESPKRAEKKEKAKNKNKEKQKSEKQETKKEPQCDISALSENARLVYEAIKDGYNYIDDIAQRLKIQIRDVLVALTELEMESLIECGAGNEYTLI